MTDEQLSQAFYMSPLQKVSNQPYLLLLLATLFWAGNAIAGKLAVGHISPFLLTSIRWFVAAMILVIVAHKHLLRDWIEIKSRIVFLFVLGAMGFAIFNNLMYLALTKTSAINAVIIQSSLPLFIFILNFLVFRLTASKYQIIAMPLSVIGVLLITTRAEWQVLRHLEFNVGDLLMVVAVFFYAIYSILLKDKPNLHWLSFVAVLSCSAVVASIPFVAWEGVSQALLWPDLTGWMIVLYTAIFPSVLAQAFWIRSIELIGSNATGFFINLVPLLGTILAIFLLGETLHAYHFVGMLMIISGVSLAQRAVATKLI